MLFSIQGKRRLIAFGALLLAASVLGAGWWFMHSQKVKPVWSQHGQVRLQPHEVLDERMKLLAAELDLDAAQQEKIKWILEDQRIQIKNLWDDTSVPASIRVVSTQAMSAKTAERIRALLNDRQKEKYSKPRKPPSAADHADKRRAEEWMNDMQAK